MENPEPGERRRRLARPPSERYAAPPAESDGAAEPVGSGAVIRAVAIGLGGAVAMTILGGPLSVTAGLLAVAVLVGWAIGSILRPALALAVALAAGSAILGLVGIWLYARSEGGVLGLIDYLGQVEGPLAPLLVGLAAFVAAARVR